MPVRLFTDAERERLNRFPSDVPPGDLLAWFTLSDADLGLIGDRRGDHNRLGYALQLKALRTWASSRTTSLAHRPESSPTWRYN